ncbi:MULTISPECIES: hypothetical protein [unclassified Streptomyces]|uniref:hypothetical protein n=1 Tax=unclassified Streptomyces TaxID=2593676 RepID=UPI000A9BD3F9|nr:hypothetical protein [Streptomyces sp. TSRI0281]
MKCDKCTVLRAELAKAVKAGDHSKATDCRVLLNRHPEHGTSPAAKRWPRGTRRV